MVYVQRRFFGAESDLATKAGNDGTDRPGREVVVGDKTRVDGWKVGRVTRETLTSFDSKVRLVPGVGSFGRKNRSSPLRVILQLKQR